MEIRQMTERTCTYHDPWNQLRCTECAAIVDLCLCANVGLSAHERLTSADGIVLSMIRGELNAARGQFPDSTHMMVALMEEVGELSQAMIDHDRDGSKTAQQVLREAVQVATMAIRVAVEGDDNFAYLFPVPASEQRKRMPTRPM
jgi:hypothetical protein